MGSLAEYSVGFHVLGIPIAEEVAKNNPFSLVLINCKHSLKYVVYWYVFTICFEGCLEVTLEPSRLELKIEVDSGSSSIRGRF